MTHAPVMTSAFPVTETELQHWRSPIDTPVWERFPEATAANAQEVYPGVGDPLSFDMNLNAIEHGQRTFVQQIGLAGTMHLAERREPGFFPVFYGKVHINIAAWREIARSIPGTTPDALDEQLFGKTRDPNAPLWKPGPREQALRLRTLVKLLPLMRRTPRDLARNEATVEGFLQELQTALPLAGMEIAPDAPARTWDDARLMATLDTAMRRNFRTTEIHIRVTIFSGSVLEPLRAFLVKRGVADPDARLADLCTGLRDIESAKPGRELERLAAFVHDDPALRELFHGEPPAILRALTGELSGSERIFRGRFDTFLRRYGYRGVRELGLATHVWAQRPEAVLALIKNQAEQRLAHDAEAEVQHQEERREAAMRTIEAGLNAWGRRRFRGLVRAAHQGIAAREQAKAQWARTTHCLRLISLELGRRLVERGVIPTVDDVFYIRLPDLRAAVAGHPPVDLASRIALYRETKAICERTELPERFTGRPLARWREEARQVAGPLGGVLRGIPVSPGRVTARARVIRGLQDDVDLEPGEILVCPFTDAAWTPLFFNAAAVVMDLGGPLSHGSTVAREYGLPAVVNVKTGTRMIRDGQQVTVDGTRGEVLLG